MTPTKSGILHIANSTRYNTDDIVNLFSTFEDRMQARGIAPELNESTTKVADVVDYKPARLSSSQNVWDEAQNSYIYKMVPTYVKDGSYRIGKRHLVSIVPPDMVYDNPIEALTQLSNNLVPALMIAQLLRRISQFYNYPTGSDGYQKRQEVLKEMTAEAESGDIKLRIEEKRGDGKPADMKLRKARGAALQAATAVTWDLKATQDKARSLKWSFANLQSALASAKVPSELNAMEMNSILLTLDRYQAQVEAAQAALL